MKKNILQILLILCLVLASSMTVFAEEGEYIYSDTDQIRYVDDINEYLAQLNAGLITPTNTTIATYEGEAIIRPFGIISDPSKGCSNIFGHSWGNWEIWSEQITKHNGSKCYMQVQRTRYCSRTYCGAYQTETELVEVACRH